MIDPFHLEAYGVTTVNYNRDIEIFPVLRTIFERIYGECPYKSPTDMGVNMAGFSIVDDEVCREASRQEVIRRYFQAACRVRQGQNAQSEVDKIELLMRTLDIEPERRAVVPAAMAVAERTGKPARRHRTGGWSAGHGPHDGAVWRGFCGGAQCAQDHCGH